MCCQLWIINICRDANLKCLCCCKRINLCACIGFPRHYCFRIIKCMTVILVINSAVYLAVCRFKVKSVFRYNIILISIRCFCKISGDYTTLIICTLYASRFVILYLTHKLFSIQIWLNNICHHSDIPKRSPFTVAWVTLRLNTIFQMNII